jgi:hypothetical protein
MKFHIHAHRAFRGRWDARRRTSVLAMTIACAALFVASQFANQAAAQSRFDRGISDHVATSTQGAPAPTLQTRAAVATPLATAADTDNLTSVPEAPVPSAPVSSFDEASLVSPTANLFLSLALDGGQSSSSQNLPPENSPSNAPPLQPRAVKTKSPHHGLGVALAVVGTAALVSGIALFATEQSIGFCSPSSHGCSEAKDAGLVLMPVGAGVAITGFYLQFHR